MTQKTKNNTKKRAFRTIPNREFIGAMRKHSEDLESVVDTFARNTTHDPLCKRDDLHSAALYGMWDAKRRYDPCKGTLFKTYLHSRMQRNILDYMRDVDPITRYSRDQEEHFWNTLEELRAELRRSPTRREFAHALGLSREEFGDRMYYMALMQKGTHIHLDGVVEEEGEEVTPHDSVGDVRSPSPFLEAVRSEQKDILWKALKVLPTRSRQVVVLYHIEDLLMREIAEIYNLTVAMVSLIYIKALKRLREFLNLNLKGELLVL